METLHKYLFFGQVAAFHCDTDSLNCKGSWSLHHCRSFSSSNSSSHSGVRSATALIGKILLCSKSLLQFIGEYLNCSVIVVDKMNL